MISSSGVNVSQRNDFVVVVGMVANKGFGTDPDSLPFEILASKVVVFGGFSFRLRGNIFFAEETRRVLTLTPDGMPGTIFVNCCCCRCIGAKVASKSDDDVYGFDIIPVCKCPRPVSPVLLD